MRNTYLYTLCIFSILGCGTGNQVTCTTSFSTPTAHPDSENNFACPFGQALVGYNPNAIGGPLLCATQITTCPVPTK